ncbi:MAG TPA: ABC transporter ATP-binding protein [Terriglobales bacterium]|nr:ABC transporter ATP-binding protein [Terriglobales bacterium]
MANEQPLLAVDLNVDFPNKPRALWHVSFEIRRGEVLGLVGESGSGKSTIALAVLKLLACKGAKATGRVMFRDRDLMAASECEMRHIRGREIALVLQSPLASLNPALRIGTQLAESWHAHAKGTKSDSVVAIERVLSRVSLPQDQEFRDRYPSQISVGQAQRVLIAMAIMHSPALLIADEPTSALDVITQAETVRLFAELNRTIGSALLYISHDLMSIASVCHRIAILHDGEIVECGGRDDVLARPVHPYTQQLLACVPWLAKPAGPAVMAANKTRQFPNVILPASAVSRRRPPSTVH